MKSSGGKFLVVFLCLLGCYFLAKSVFAFPKALRLASAGVETTGKITQKFYEGKTAKGGNQIYRPGVEFTADGQKYTYIGNATDDYFSVNDSVSIVYDPDQPACAEINSFWDTWGGTLGNGGISLGALWLPIYLMVLMLKRK